MNDIIKAAADKKYPDDPKTFAHIENYRQEFVENVLDGIKALQSHGYAVVKVVETPTGNVINWEGVVKNLPANKVPAGKYKLVKIEE